VEKEAEKEDKDRNPGVKDEKKKKRGGKTSVSRSKTLRRSTGFKNSRGNAYNGPSEVPYPKWWRRLKLGNRGCILIKTGAARPLKGTMAAKTIPTGTKKER